MGSVCEGRIERGLDDNLGELHQSMDEFVAAEERAMVAESNGWRGGRRRVESEREDVHGLAHSHVLCLCSLRRVQFWVVGQLGRWGGLVHCSQGGVGCLVCLQKAAVWYEVKGQQFVLTFDLPSSGIAVPPGPPDGT